MHPRPDRSPAEGPGSQHAAVPADPQPLNDMDDEDREATDIMVNAFGTETYFYRAIISDGVWAKSLAKAMSVSLAPIRT